MKTPYCPALRRRNRRLVHVALLLASLLPGAAATANAGDPLAWPAVTSQCRPWAYWWWMGSAVDRTNLTRELQRYHEAGLGGVHIIPIYGARGFESNYIPYLSPHWMEMMGWSVAEAKRLGMGVDMTTGTGWCFGGPQVTERDANASVVVKTFALAGGETLKGPFNLKSTQALVAYSARGETIELTPHISAVGSVDWVAPAGTWTVYAISQKPSSQKVKRAAPGGEGWMLNLFYPPAMTDFLRPFTEAFANYTGPKPRAQYHDSYEYKSDWAPDFFAQFEQRRGYRLQNELPALFGPSADEPNDHAARVRCDYRETVSDLMVEETMPHWTKWAHDEGFITRYEAHGSPGNWLDLYATADIPETEFFSKHRNPLISKFASSATHVKGGRLTAAETGTWLAEHFTETLADVKYVADDMFLSGINHIFYHGCCYSPDEAGWPGWHFYASTEMNPRNPIWRDVGTVNGYIARVQSVFQSGESDNDILLYWPIADFWMEPGDARLPHLRVEAQDWFSKQPVGQTAQALWDRGCAFDYVSDRQLQTAQVRDGRVRMPGGDYRVILVPKCAHLPLATFRQLLTLANQGATVVFEQQFPTDIPGAFEVDRQRAELRQLEAGLAPLANSDRNPGYVSQPVGQGRICLAFGQFAGTGPLERATSIAREPLTDAGLSFVRRTFDGGWHYFIANRGGTAFDGWVILGRPATSAVLLDPLTGTTGVAAIQPADSSAAGQRAVHLRLAAGESILLRAFADQTVSGPAWNYWQTNGTPIALARPWTVRFLADDPAPAAAVSIDHLASWTTFPATNATAFAGTAHYETVFDAPQASGQPVLLELGDVRQSARVKLNGRDYGTLVAPPFQVVVENLQPAGNRLEVEVTSVAANRIRDLDQRGVPWKTFHDINIVDINYKPFNAAAWPLTECGLLGPVTLTALKPAP